MKKLAISLAVCACTAPADPDALRARLTPDVVARLQVPMIFVHLPRRGVAATLVPVGRNDQVRSWRSGDGVQLSYARGVLVATRGVGHDLMSADVSGTLAALAGGPSGYARSQSRVDGTFRTVSVTHHCEMVQPGVVQHISPQGPIPVRVFAETCSGTPAYENQYHLGADGTVWWSRQWISAGAGVVETERIRR